MGIGSIVRCILWRATQGHCKLFLSQFWQLWGPLVLFLLIIFNIIQRKANYIALQSTSQAVLKTNGRLSLLKQRNKRTHREWRESLAVVCAASLQILLTQQKLQLIKDSLKLKMLLMILLMVQSGVYRVEESGSKQFFASPSKMTWLKFSAGASWTAQRMEWASAWMGEQWGRILVHTLMTWPCSSLAVTARA